MFTGRDKFRGKCFYYLKDGIPRDEGLHDTILEAGDDSFRESTCRTATVNLIIKLGFTKEQAEQLV